jgi:hypothetical protein
MHHVNARHLAVASQTDSRFTKLLYGQLSSGWKWKSRVQAVTSQGLERSESLDNCVKRIPPFSANSEHLLTAPEIQRRHLHKRAVTFKDVAPKLRNLRGRSKRLD